MTTVERARHAWWSAPVAGLCLLGLGLVFAAAMPDPMATHWGFSGRPDGSIPRWMGIAVIPLTVTILALVGTGREVEQRKVLVGWLSFGLMMQSSLLWANAGASDWTEARNLWLWIPFVLGVPLALVWYVGRHGQPVAPALVVPPTPSTNLAPGQRGAWSSSASNRWAMLLDVGLLVAGVALGQFVLVLAAVVCMPFNAVRVSAGNQGVVLYLGVPGIFRKRYPLEAIASATVGDYQSFSFGYRGSRKAMRAAAWAIRRGESLVLQLKDGTTVSITVDDAAQGAALINALT